MPEAGGGGVRTSALKLDNLTCYGAPTNDDHNKKKWLFLPSSTSCRGHQRGKEIVAVDTALSYSRTATVMRKK